MKLKTTLIGYYFAVIIGLILERIVLVGTQYNFLMFVLPILIWIGIDKLHEHIKSKQSKVKKDD